MNTPAENRKRVALLNAEGRNMPLRMTGDEIRHAECFGRKGKGPTTAGKTEYVGGWQGTNRKQVFRVRP